MTAEVFAVSGWTTTSRKGLRVRKFRPIFRGGLARVATSVFSVAAITIVEEVL